jgi:hypothetical protein
MNKYFYYILLIFLLNYLLFKVYFLNFNFYINSKNKLKQDFKKASNNYIYEQPKLILKLSKLTKELNDKLIILDNK